MAIEPHKQEPCPFCGAPGWVRKYMTGWYTLKATSFRPECSLCSCKLTEYDNLEIAINAWNTRSVGGA